MYTLPGTTSACENAGMDDTGSTPGTGPALGRRAFFGRALLAAGAAVSLVGLTGCPGGEQGDDDDRDDEDRDDEDDD